MAENGNSRDAALLYEQGRGLLRKDQPSHALPYFKKSYECNPLPDILPAVQSYLGYTLAIVEGSEHEAFELMHDALKSEFYRADFFLNLGKAYLAKAGRRKQALNAFYSGLKIAPQDPDILEVLQEVGTRKKPPFKFLPRDHFINIWLGKKLNRREKLPPVRRPLVPTNKLAQRAREAALKRSLSL